MKQSILALVLLFCTSITCLPATAQVGGYRLISQTGEVGTTPGDFIKSVSWSQLAAPSAPQKMQSLDAILPNLVNDFQEALRVEPDPKATSIQRDELADKKYDHIRNVASVMPGQAVSASFQVLDVVPVVSTPQQPAPAAFLVYGQFDWKASPILTDEDKRKIVAINQKYDAADKAAQAKYDRVIGAATTVNATNSHQVFQETSVDNRIAQNASDQLNKSKSIDASKRKSEVDHIRSAELTKVPCHMIYVYTNDDTVANWRRDEIHKTIGFMQEIAAFQYTQGVLLKNSAGVSEPLQDAYVSMEFVIKGVKGDLPSQTNPIDPSATSFDPPK